jgi:hypothetical protein
VEGGSFADRVFGGLTDDQMRLRPAKGLNSLAWLLWHMARTEDVVVNVVIGRESQVLDDAWLERCRGARRASISRARDLRRLPSHGVVWPPALG